MRPAADVEPYAGKSMTPEQLATGPATFAKIAELPVTIDAIEYTPLVRDTSSGFTKITTVIRLRGGHEDGLGEDVTWDQIDQIELVRRPTPDDILGSRTLAELSAILEEVDLFPVPPCRPASRHYRRWAFESAALDLGLRQAGLSLADALGRTPQPVRFVSSVRLGEPPSVDPIRARLRADPTLQFKLDPTLSWTSETLEEIATVCSVQVVDLKGLYRNAAVELPPDAALYQRVIDAFPDAWIEDPGFTPETTPVLADHGQRVSWDEPVHAIEDLERLPVKPGALNIKPSRFGSLTGLFEAYDFCAAAGLVSYGGGMFELGPGRGQLQYLASLFHPDGPNDLAPPEYNLAQFDGRLPACPLPPEPHATGFRWGEFTLRRSIRDGSI
jgi:hypothetical protein